MNGWRWILKENCMCVDTEQLMPDRLEYEYRVGNTPPERG